MRSGTKLLNDNTIEDSINALINHESPRKQRADLHKSKVRERVKNKSEDYSGNTQSRLPYSKAFNLIEFISIILN